MQADKGSNLQDAKLDMDTERVYLTRRIDVSATINNRCLRRVMAYRIPGMLLMSNQRLLPETESRCFY